MRKNVILENLIRQGVKQCLNNRLKEDKSWSNLFGLNNDVVPDDDKGQRSLDPYEMKKMRGYFTNNKISKDEKNNNEFFDASGYKLCGKFKSNLGINLDIIFKLLNNLVDILEENENATVMTISPYSVEIAKKTYYKDPGNNLRLFVICLDVTKSSNLWNEIDLVSASHDINIIYEEYGKPSESEGWTGFWNWLLKDLIKARTVSTKLFSNVNYAVNCYSMIGLIDDIKEHIDKFKKMKSRGELQHVKGKDKSRNTLYDALIDELYNNKNLTDAEKNQIKLKIKKIRREENESWINKGKKYLGLQDDEDEV
jgi:hypothetical protein